MPINSKFGPSGKPEGTRLLLCEIISSEGKEEGWRNVLARMPDLKRSRGSTSRELLALHELTTFGAEFPAANPQSEELFFQRLILNDYPDVKGLIKAIRRAMHHLRTSRQNFESEVAFRQAARLEAVQPHFKPQLRVDLRSDIRSVGTREYSDGRTELVFDSHLLPIWTPQGNRFFLGLSYRLDELYHELCDRYDGMRSRATTIKQQILAELYLQMIGTRLLHPFWDGNGRTFAAHMLVTFNRMGLPVAELPCEKDIAPEKGDDSFVLSYVNDKFLTKVIKPFLLTEAEVGELNLKDFVKRNEYMKKLYETIRDVIRRGILENEFRPFTLMAYHQIRAWLHLKGYLPYSENPPTGNLVQYNLSPERARLLEERAACGEISPEDLDWSQFVL